MRITAAELLPDWLSDEHHLKPKGELYRGEVIYANAAPDELDAFHLCYDRIQEVGLETVIAEQVAKHHQALFFRKNVDWATEWEYRWILRSPEPVVEFVPITKSLRAVVRGQDFPSGDLDALRYLAKSFGSIEIPRCHWRNGTPVVLPDDPGVVVLDGLGFRADLRVSYERRVVELGVAVASLFVSVFLR